MSASRKILRCLGAVVLFVTAWWIGHQSVILAAILLVGGFGWAIHRQNVKIKEEQRERDRAKYVKGRKVH